MRKTFFLLLLFGNIYTKQIKGQKYNKNKIENDGYINI